ncbi:MAG: cyclase family protein [Alphaproteobacteria bacterium]
MCMPGCREAVGRTLSRRGFFGAAAATTAFAATPAQAQRGFTRVIDLTHTLSPAFPTFFGVPGIEIERRYTLRRNGANVNWWRVLEHAGTHIDAPIHYAENGAAVEAIPADQLVVPLAVVDVSEQAVRNADYALSRGDVTEWEARYGQLPDGCCVAMHSGWGRHANDAAKYTGKDAAGAFHFPGIHPEAAEWLLRERRVVGLGVDTLSLDPGRSKDFKTHATWLPSGRWGIENLANLEQVPPTGATLVAGVPKVKGATGAPARILALV